MGKEIEATKIRDGFIEQVKTAFEEHFDTFCLVTGSGILAFPGVDEQGNEFYYKIQISVPRGKRDGSGGYIPWDAEKDAEAYKIELEIKAEEKRKAEEKKKQAEEEKARKREEKKKEREAAKLAKKLAVKGLNGVIHEGIEEGA